MGNIVTSVLLGILAAANSADSEPKPIRVLVVTGGHDFERQPFFTMFDAMKGISWREAPHPDANKLYSAEAARAYDVLVFYDMNQQIDAEQQANLMRTIKADGKGLVSLHHSIANYQAWPEYHAMTGARYYLEDTVIDGKKHLKSTYEHDQQLTVRIVDANDPVTKGVTDFPIIDEVYAGFDVAGDVKPLLKVEHPKSGPLIGWSKEVGKGRLVYIQLGHGPTAYNNENYRTLVRNAIIWASKMDDAK